MKKIGLITHYGENYGGMLQAYALQRCVKEEGYDCHIISNDFLYQKAPVSKIKRLKNKLKKIIKNPISSVKRSRAMHLYDEEKKLRSARFREFASKNLVVDQTGYTCYEQYVEAPPEYDVYLCGSDQIWNPNLYNKNGFCFAGFAPEESVKISYASSLGVSSVTEQQAAFMKPYLQRLDVISTRESEGSKIVEDLTGKPVRTVLDPTLLLNAEQWDDVAAKPLINQPYVFCYLFGERDYIARVKKQIKELTGMETVCLPYVAREMAGDDVKIFDAGPAEFVSLIKNAALVVTDSFHATAFSVNLKTPFISLCRFSKNDAISMNSRMTTILGTVGLMDRLIDEEDEITKDMLFNIDFEKAHELLRARREEDIDFLKNAIEYERKKENKN